jgi:hypothetical protein
VKKKKKKKKKGLFLVVVVVVGAFPQRRSAGRGYPQTPGHGLTTTSPTFPPQTRGDRAVLHMG